MITGYIILLNHRMPEDVSKLAMVALNRLLKNQIIEINNLEEHIESLFIDESKPFQLTSRSIQQKKLYIPYNQKLELAIIATLILVSKYQDKRYKKRKYFEDEEKRKEKISNRKSIRDKYIKQAEDMLGIIDDKYTQETYEKITRIFVETLFPGDPDKLSNEVKILKERLKSKFKYYDVDGKFELIKFSKELITELIAADLELADLIKEIKEKFLTKKIKWDTLHSKLTCAQVNVPKTLLRIPSAGFCSTKGTCLYAAA
jgi:hypothetical protein